MQTSERNGLVVGIACVTDRDELLLVTEQGQIIRMKAGDLRPIGRDTQGVRLMDLAEGDQLVSIAALTEPEDEPETREAPEPEARGAPAVRRPTGSVRAPRTAPAASSCPTDANRTVTL